MYHGQTITFREHSGFPNEINVPTTDHPGKGKGFRRVGSNFGHGGRDQGNHHGGEVDWPFQHDMARAEAKGRQ